MAEAWLAARTVVEGFVMRAAPPDERQAFLPIHETFTGERGQ